MDFRSLEVFVWVASLGSFRGAAARLNTTQPAVSQRIAALEADLGVRLLERSRSGVTLTERGRVLFDGARHMLGLAAELREAVGDRDVVRGSLRLGVSETIVHTWLSRFLRRVAVAYPLLAIEVEVDISPNLADRLAQHEIDLAFMLGPSPDAAIRSRPLCRYPVGFLASPALDLPGRSLALADLAGRSLISFSRRTLPYAELAQLIGGLNPRPRVHASAALATVIRMAEDGLGIAVVPEAIAAREIAEGRLRVVVVEAALPDLAFAASWPAGPTPQLAEALAGLAALEAGTTA